MSRFTDKALTKISKLPPDEIVRILDSQNRELQLRSDILDSSDMGFVPMSPDGQVLYFNNTIYRLTDCYRKKSSGGFPITKLVKDRNICSYAISCIKGKTDEDYQYVKEDPTYGRMDVRVFVQKIANSSSRLFCFQDVTFFKRLREEYLRNESLAAMTTMAAGIAHEIKNPLASISIYLQLMQRQLSATEGFDREELLKNLKVVSDEIERLNAITVDFLFAVKPMNVKMAICNVNSVVERACNISGPELEQQGIRLEKNLATSLPKADFDCNLIEQAILNLMGNAMQAMVPGKPDPCIQVGTMLNGDNICITVKDNGCGINDEQLSRIFEPYYTTKAGGTGLGLTNIFKIMKLHNGEVSVSSQYGEGSEFTLSLPVPRSERLRLEMPGGGQQI